jgi:phosphoribosylformylglycinamidine synthase
MRTAVVVFPGTNCEQDVVYALEQLGGTAELVWHRETDLDDFDSVVIPGGFAHGDYLRTGAIARLSPVMGEVARLAETGRPILGICNGFQILCEAGLLPGAFIANRELSFICRLVDVEVVDVNTVISRGLEAGRRLRIPLNSYEGSWVDPGRSGRVVIRYVGDPNGSQDRAAAVANRTGNVVGIMPHPERAVEEVLGSSDGQMLLRSFLSSVVTA